MEKYSALIIDFVNSRMLEVERRNLIQLYVSDLINNLNTVFSQTLVKKVEFSAGDELQGLFLSPTAAFMYFRLFKMYVHPINIRGGIGIGEWNIKIDNASSTSQDGPVYHNARYAIEHVEESLSYSLLLYSEKEKDIDLLANATINVPFLLTDNQTLHQNEIRLLHEILHPLDSNNTLAKTSKGLIHAARNENRKKLVLTSTKRNGDKVYPFENINSESVEISPVSIDDEDNEFYSPMSKIKGVSSELAKLLDTSRQNVEKILKLGRISEERSYTIVALRFLLSTYKWGKL